MFMKFNFSFLRFVINPEAGLHPVYQFFKSSSTFEFFYLFLSNQSIRFRRKSFRIYYNKRDSVFG